MTKYLKPKNAINKEKNKLAWSAYETALKTCEVYYEQEINQAQSMCRAKDKCFKEQMIISEGLKDKNDRLNRILDMWSGQNEALEDKIKDILNCPYSYFYVDVDACGSGHIRKSLPYKELKDEC